MTISKGAYDLLLSKFPDKAKFSVANWLAHDMEIVGATELILDRYDYKERSEYMLINHKGESCRISRGLIGRRKGDTICVDKERYRADRKELRELRQFKKQIEEGENYAND